MALIGIFNNTVLEGINNFPATTNSYAINFTKCDKVGILDTDDFVLQFINYDKLKDIMKRGILEFENMFYDHKDNSVNVDFIRPNILSFDSEYTYKSKDDIIELYYNSYVVEGQNNRIKIAGTNISFNFELNNDGEYKFLVNGEQFGWFYSHLFGEYDNILDVIDTCLMGIPLVYRINSNYIGVVFEVVDVYNFASCLLIFDNNGTCIDMWVDSDEANFSRLNRPVSNIVAKCETLKKGLYIVC